MKLYEYVCDKHYSTIRTWVDWKADDDESLPCCCECGKMDSVRYVGFVEIKL